MGLLVQIALSAILVLASGSNATAEPRPAVSVNQFAALRIANGGRHADPELEALLPTTLGGMALIVESQSGSELTTKSGPFDAFLAGLGKTRDDFSLASAYANSGLKAEIGAWRVRGADSALLLPGFQKAVQGSSTTPINTATETFAGRQVTRIGDPGQLTRGPLYVVVRGDTLLFVQTTEPALAEEAIGKLPE